MRSARQNEYGAVRRELAYSGGGGELIKLTALRQRMIDAMQVRGLAARTQQADVDALARMSRHFGCSPAALHAAQIEAYMLHLSKDLRRSFSTINQVSPASRLL